MSMSLPAVIACRAASARFAEKPVADHLANRSPVGDDEALEAPLALQDVALQVRAPRRRMPPISLKEFMNVAAPASAAALNGGSTTFCSVLSEMSTVL